MAAVVESLKCVADRDVSLHKASRLVVVYLSSVQLFIHVTSWLAKISPVCRCRELHLHIPQPAGPCPRAPFATRDLVIASRYLVMGQYVCRLFLRCKKLPISTARHLRLRNPSYVFLRVKPKGVYNYGKGTIPYRLEPIVQATWTMILASSPGCFAISEPSTFSYVIY